MNPSWETMWVGLSVVESSSTTDTKKTFNLRHVFSFLWFLWSILNSLIPRIVVYGKTTSDGGFRWPVGWFSETHWHVFTTVRSNLRNTCRREKESARLGFERTTTFRWSKLYFSARFVTEDSMESILSRSNWKIAWSTLHIWPEGKSVCKTFCLKAIVIVFSRRRKELVFVPHLINAFRGVARIFPGVRTIFQIHPNTSALSHRFHIPWLYLLLLSVWWGYTWMDEMATRS